ncbi:MAG: hypothetical protein HUU16_10030 [Candidatus Omnitrophica bacterium]|nr:hypothetical protein [Candidatus Omnitrophota bacterium]
MDLRRLNWKRVILLLAGLYLLGRYLFSGLGVTEAQRVLLVVTRAEEAVQKKSLLGLQQVLSSDYQDRSGLSRSDILRLAASYFRGQDSVSILRLGSSVEFEGEDLAEVELRIQVVGRSGGEVSLGFRDSTVLGELYHLKMRKERGEWKILSVDPEGRDWPKGF